MQVSCPQTTCCSRYSVYNVLCKNHHLFIRRWDLNIFLIPTEYASLMLIDSPVAAACPAIPTPKGTQISSSSDLIAWSTVDSEVTSKSLDTKTLLSLEPRTRKSEQRSAFVNILTLTSILWLSIFMSNSLAMSLINSMNNSFSSNSPSFDFRRRRGTDIFLSSRSEPNMEFSLPLVKLLSFLSITWDLTLSLLTWLTSMARDPGRCDLLLIQLSTIEDVAFRSK